MKIESKSDWVGAMKARYKAVIFSMYYLRNSSDEARKLCKESIQFFKEFKRETLDFDLVTKRRKEFLEGVGFGNL